MRPLPQIPRRRRPALVARAVTADELRRQMAARGYRLVDPNDRRTGGHQRPANERRWLASDRRAHDRRRAADRRAASALSRSSADIGSIPTDEAPASMSLRSWTGFAVVVAVLTVAALLVMVRPA